MLSLASLNLEVPNAFESPQDELMWNLLHYDVYSARRNGRIEVSADQGTGWVLKEELFGGKGPLRPSKLGVSRASIESKAYLILNHPLIEGRHRKHPNGSLLCRKRRHGGKWKNCRESAYRLKQDHGSWIQLYFVFAVKYGRLDHFLASEYVTESPITEELFEKFTKLFGPMNLGLMLVKSYPRLFGMFLQNPTQARKLLDSALEKARNFDQLMDSTSRGIGTGSVRLTGESEFAIRCGIFNQELDSSVQKRLNEDSIVEGKMPAGFTPTRPDAAGGI